MYARGEVAADTLNAFMKEVAEEERRVEWDKGPLMSLTLAEACSVPTLEGMVELIRLVTPFGSKMEKWQKTRLIKHLKNKDCEDYPLPKKTRVLSEPSHAMPF